ncbi:MAG TPA: hypothetical protein VD903_15500 [Pseudonocardia sp.]|nr:hypothetical protein [Pseudonocardia sp.]
MLVRLWTRLTTCEVDGCTRWPVHLGWCDRHVPSCEPGPDEYWGEPTSGVVEGPLAAAPRTCSAHSCTS